jgi:hypothetical protein
MEHDLDYQFCPDDRAKRLRIGVIGAGFIVRDCHLVAYRQAGFCVEGIASRTPERAQEVAARHAISRVYRNYQELLEDPRIEIVDLAVPPQYQPQIIEEAVRHAGHVRGILAQKPLAMSHAAARRVVSLCRDAGVTLAVNQNMRHDQSVRACKCLLERGWLGQPVLATIEMRAIPHWMPWSQQLHSLATFIMSIHHLDCFRYWFGNPDRVLASTRADPRTRFPHSDGVNLYILEFASGCRAMSCDDVWAGPVREGSAADVAIRWRVEGLEGMARGTIGWPNYPVHTPSTIDYTCTRFGNRWFEPRWREAWFPEAFRGTMAELLLAVATGTEPSISGEDNLQTLALVEAVFRGAQEHRVVELKEITG